MKLQAMIEKHEEQLKGLKHEITRQLGCMKQNPRVTQLDDNCFSVSSRALGERWDVLYHDFDAQYALIARRVEELATAREILNMFRQVKKGTLRIGNHTYRFHPEVAERIGELI